MINEVRIMIIMINNNDTQNEGLVLIQPLRLRYYYTVQ